jgi:hypothetical protein
MMHRALAVVAILLLLPTLSYSQGTLLTTITGHIQTVDGQPLTAGTKVVFELLYCGNNRAYVIGTANLPVTRYEARVGHGLSTDGTISVHLYGNDKITCGPVTGDTNWRVTYVVNNQASEPCIMHITGTDDPWNLDTASCLNSKPVPLHIDE